MYRTYVEPTLHVVLQLFLQVASHHVEVHRCLGKCLSALVITLGPELQGSSSKISSVRAMCLTSCSIMSDHPDPLVSIKPIQLN